MAETQSAPSLRELSEAVPQCEWKASGRYIGTANHMSLIGECRDENGNWSDTKISTAKAAFVARLASDYFAGLLIDPTTLSEAVASARAEGVREGLERAAGIIEKSAVPALRGVSAAIRALIPAPPTTPGGRTDGSR